MRIVQGDSIDRQPTRGVAVLDCIYTNLHQYYCDPTILPSLLLSDHMVVLAEPKLAHQIPRPRPRRITKRCYPSSHKTLFAHALTTVDWSTLYHLDTCQEKFQKFSNTIDSLLDGFFPLKTITVCPTDKPWITPRFKEHIASRQKYLKQGNRTMYNFYRNLVGREAKSLRRKYYADEIEQLKSTEPGKWWRAVHSFLGTNSGSSSLDRLHRTMDTDIKGLAKMINDFFESVSSEMTPLQPLPDDTPRPVVPDEYLLTVDQVERSLSTLNTRKSPGPDGIPSWILHDFSTSLAAPVCHIFNSSIIEGYVPDMWKSANVVPVPKIANPTNIKTDLRPISLTPALSKYLENHICQWLMASIGNKVDQNQYGNVKGRSTTHALIRLLHDWHQATDTSNGYVRALLVDFSKAFDRIDHNIIITKLRDLEVPAVLLHWIHAFLSMRKQRVKLHGVCSEWTTVNGGVPQETKLGPLLFLVMINDLTLSLPAVKYVDDTTVYQVIRKDEVDILQQQLDELCAWCRTNKMLIN